MLQEPLQLAKDNAYGAKVSEAFIFHRYNKLQGTRVG